MVVSKGGGPKDILPRGATKTSETGNGQVDHQMRRFARFGTACAI